MTLRKRSDDSVPKKRTEKASGRLQLLVCLRHQVDRFLFLVYHYRCCFLSIKLQLHSNKHQMFTSNNTSPSSFLRNHFLYIWQKQWSDGQISKFYQISQVHRLTIISLTWIETIQVNEKLTLLLNSLHLLVHKVYILYLLTDLLNIDIDVAIFRI